MIDNLKNVMEYSKIAHCVLAEILPDNFRVVNKD